MCRYWNAQLRGRTCVCQRNVRKTNMVIWREARGWIVDGAGGWPQGWLDTEEETMKGRLSSAPHLLLCTVASQLTAARLSLSDPPRCATWRENEREHCWSSWLNWMGALLLLQSLPALRCWKDLHGNHPAGSWGHWENGVWEVIPYTVSVVIPSVRRAGAEEAAAPWGVLLCSADLEWDGMGWDGWGAEDSWGSTSSSPLKFSVLVWSADTAACWRAHSQKIQGSPDCNPALPLSASCCLIPHLWLGSSNDSASLSRCSSSGVQVPVEVLIFIACKGEGGFSALFKQREMVYFQISKHIVVQSCPRNYCGIFIKDVFHKLWYMCFTTIALNVSNSVLDFLNSWSEREPVTVSSRGQRRTWEKRGFYICLKLPFCSSGYHFPSILQEKSKYLHYSVLSQVSP